MTEPVDLPQPTAQSLLEPPTQPGAGFAPRIRELLARADRALHVSAEATLEAERKLGLARASRAVLEADQRLRALDRERARLLQEVEALRLERDVIRADIDQLVRQGLERRRDLQAEVDHLEVRAQALLQGIHLLGRQMMDAVTAASALAAELGLPEAAGAFVAVGPTPQPSDLAETPAPMTEALPSASIAPRLTLAPRRGWLWPTLALSGLAAGLSLLAWLAGWLPLPS